VLAGPTGEHNAYSIAPRTGVLCLAADERDRLVQLAAVLALESRAIWPDAAQPLLDRLPAGLRAHVRIVRDPLSATEPFDAVLLHGDAAQLAEVQARLARRDGPVIGVERLDPGATAVPLERLVVERALSVNTAAAGGNASLMTMD
jgi:RHH-type proline utilization regulon transcriptional repressor/proline dehydrogenase/delta 1-pyrroline-5-carboxylate dehydrogenase